MSSINSFSQPPTQHVWWTTTATYQVIQPQLPYFPNPPQPPCSCTNGCADMITHARMYSTTPTPQDVQLLGGTDENGLHCQYLELNLSACNGQQISSINFTFDTDNTSCGNGAFYTYYQKSDGTIVPYLNKIFRTLLYTISSFPASIRLKSKSIENRGRS